jgi:predicted metal-dependent HD superfamily phosphohydrolase
MSRLIGVDECDLQEDVDAIIIATKDHDIDPEQNPIGALVIDIDMAILGADKERYRQYRAQIRKEFSAFPDDVFNQTRRDSFLYPSVRKPRLYLTDVMQERFGDYAVENMFEEIGDLNRLIPRRARDSAFSAKPA